MKDRDSLQLTTASRELTTAAIIKYTLCLVQCYKRKEFESCLGEKMNFQRWSSIEHLAGPQLRTKFGVIEDNSNIIFIAIV